MQRHSIKLLAGALVLVLFGGLGTAQASIKSQSPDIDFTNGGTTIDLFNPGHLSGPHAIYSFKDNGNQGLSDTVSVKTSGSGLVASTFGTAPASYFTGARAPFISADLLVSSFRSFNDYTKIPFSGTATYIALALDFNDGRHYGYAEVDGPQLLSYGFQTIAGKGIQAGATGQTSTAVPGPGSLTMLGLGVMLIGFGAMSARRRKS